MACKCISFRPISCEDVHVDKMLGLSACILCDGERKGSVYEKGLSEEPDRESTGPTKRDAPCENGRLEAEDNRKEEIVTSIEDQVESLVPDGGWGWVVVFGAALILVSIYIFFFRKSDVILSVRESVYLEGKLLNANWKLFNP